MGGWRHAPSVPGGPAWPAGSPRSSARARLGAAALQGAHYHPAPQLGALGNSQCPPSSSPSFFLSLRMLRSRSCSSATFRLSQQEAFPAVWGQRGARGVPLAPQVPLAPHAIPWAPTRCDPAGHGGLLKPRAAQLLIQVLQELRVGRSHQGRACHNPGSPTVLGTQRPQPGSQRGQLTRGFTSSFPVTVNMVERPNGVHTEGGSRG